MEMIYFLIACLAVGVCGIVYNLYAMNRDRHGTI